MNRESIHGEISRQSRRQGLWSEDQGSEDALRPGRSGLVRRCNEDVVVAWHKMVPTGAVEMVVAVLPGSLGWFEPHGSTSSHEAIFGAEPNEPDWHRPRPGERGHYLESDSRMIWMA